MKSKVKSHSPLHFIKNVRSTQTLSKCPDRQSPIDEIDRSLVYGDLVEAYQKYAPNTKTVVFCIDIAHSEQTAAAYLAAGISAEHIDGEVDYKERKAILDRFRSGETQILTNCELILEGFDLNEKYSEKPRTKILDKL